EIPEFQFSPFGYFSFGGGSCIGFTSNVSMGKISGQIVFDKHCQPWETIFRPPLEWALYLSTALYIYILFSRTVRSV
uniref:cytochrome P450 n=3 Tax=Vibrio cholerae TaxID=666 RepID=UPI001C2F8767